MISPTSWSSGPSGCSTVFSVSLPPAVRQLPTPPALWSLDPAQLLEEYRGLLHRYHALSGDACLELRFELPTSSGTLGA